MTYSLMIARELGLDKATQRTVAVAALLHDVGKIGVPDAILRKPGRLTPEEFEAIKQHPQMGAIMVTAVPGLEETLDAVGIITSAGMAMATRLGCGARRRRSSRV